jgi:NADH/NAD ratio-sensing transcriptional regulator Rex
MREEIYVTCFDQKLSNDFIEFVGKQGLGCERFMALNATANPDNMTQLTVIGASVAAVATAIYNFIKSRKIEVVMEVNLESKTTTIGKQNAEKEVENFIGKSKSQQIILKAKI